MATSEIARMTGASGVATGNSADMRKNRIYDVFSTTKKETKPSQTADKSKGNDPNHASGSKEDVEVSQRFAFLLQVVLMLPSLGVYEGSSECCEGFGV